MERKSNLELCRVVSMEIIILNHIVSLGEVIDGVTFDGNTLVSLLFLLGGKFGTTVFVILGLYFLVDENEFNSKRIVRIWLESLFYLIILNIFDILVFGVKISITTWIRSFLPVLGRMYWFSSSYIILLMIIPLLSHIYEGIDNKIFIVTVGTLLLSVFPTITFNGTIFGSSLIVKWFFKLLMFGPVWFSYLYFIVRYFKETQKSWRSLRCWITFLLAYMFMYTIEILMYKSGLEGNTFMLQHYSTIRDMSSFPCLVAAGSFFLAFKNIKIRQSKLINYIASVTFGIYLLHTHETTVPIFWRGLFHLDIISKTGWYLLYSLFLVMIIFLVGIVTEIIRKHFEQKFFKNTKIIKCMNVIDNKVNSVLQRLLNGGLVK